MKEESKEKVRASLESLVLFLSPFGCILFLSRPFSCNQPAPHVLGE